MKGRMLLAGALALGVLLASCTGGPEEAAPIDGADGATISATHKYGSTAIPANPQRAFVTLQRYADPLLALGIKPATIVAYGNIDQLAAYADGVTVLSEYPITPEAVLAARPDFILGDPWIDQTTYEQFSKIAPTIVLGQGEVPPTWKEVFLYLAQTFDRQAEYDSYMQGYNDIVAQTRLDLDKAIGDETVMILRVALNRIMLWGKGPGSTEEIIHKDLGLNPPPGLPDSWTNISLESLTDYDADHIFLELRTTTEGSRQFFEDHVAGSAVWSSMKAVKENHIYPISSDLWVEGNGPISYLALIEQVRDYLLTPAE